jgi:microcystin-dependent protein
MTWPSSDVVTSAMDGGTDTPPRAEFFSMAQKFNQLRNHVTVFMQGLLDDTTAATARATLEVYSTAQVDSAVAAAVPTSAVAFFPRSTAPTGWIKANGAAVSRTTYAALFAIIGTTFGAGNGSTTFNLPDLRGEFPRGWDDGRGVDTGRTLGSSQSGQNQAHTHTGSAASAGAHTHNVTYGSASNTSNVYPSKLSTGSFSSASTESAGAHTHSLSIDSQGGTEARPRNVALLACIKF